MRSGLTFATQADALNWLDQEAAVHAELAAATSGGTQKSRARHAGHAEGLQQAADAMRSIRTENAS